MSYLRLTRPADGVALIEIERPEARNALNRDAQHQFDALLAVAEEDPRVRAVVLAGAGGKALSAGWDIHEMLGLDRAANLELLAEREEWLWRWYSYPKATVAALTGIAYGAGALLAACADLRVGGPGTRFKVTGMTYGYPNLTWLLPSLLGLAAANEILLTGAAVPGPRAHQLGLLTRLVPDEEIRDAAVALASEVAALPPDGVRNAKLLMRPDVREAFERENQLEREALHTRDAADVFTPFTNRRYP